MKFRRRPTEVEAMQFMGHSLTLGNTLKYAIEFDMWLAGHKSLDVKVPRYIGDTLHITTIHEQPARVEPGDWVVREPKKGYFYPVKHEIFAAIYEPVSPPEPIVPSAPAG